MFILVYMSKIVQKLATYMVCECSKHDLPHLGKLIKYHFTSDVWKLNNRNVTHMLLHYFLRTLYLQCSTEILKILASNLKKVTQKGPGPDTHFGFWDVGAPSFSLKLVLSIGEKTIKIMKT